jgi:hypothetical protein
LDDLSPDKFYSTGNSQFIYEESIGGIVFAGTYQLMDADSDRPDQKAKKIFRMVTIPELLTPNYLHHDCQLFFLNLNVIKMKNEHVQPYLKLFIRPMK